MAIWSKILFPKVYGWSRDGLTKFKCLLVDVRSELGANPSSRYEKHSRFHLAFLTFKKS